MAVAKVICSDCGAGLRPGDRFCAQCGAKIEQEGETAAPSLSPSPVPANADVPPPRTCEVCGHRNEQAGTFCEECGDRLPGAPAAAAPAAPKEKKQKKKPAVAGFRVEPWHYASAVLFAGIVILFIMVEADRVLPPATTVADAGDNAHPHANLPEKTSQAITEITRLEQAVNDNPDDASSLLRLANLLHDVSRDEPVLSDRAANAYTRYLALRPDDADARVDLGIVYFSMARTDSLHRDAWVQRSIEEMTTVAEKDPRHQPAAFNLGIVNLNVGNADEASRWFRKAVAINPSSELGKRAQELLTQHASPFGN